MQDSEPLAHASESSAPGPRLWRHLRQELKHLEGPLRPPDWYRAHVPESLRKVVRVGIWTARWFRQRAYVLGCAAKSGWDLLRGRSINRTSDAEQHRQTKLRLFLDDSAARIRFPGCEQPLVSILILNYNRADQLLECLESVKAHTNDVPHELIVADNASTDRAPEVLNRVDGANVLLNEENLGFIRGNNGAAIHARGRYLLLLNNDTIVTPGWLSALVNTLEQYPDCGAVGPRFLYPDGRLQEAGSTCWADGHVDQVGIYGDAFGPEFQHVREVDYVSGACLLIRTELFRRLGGFDERYVPCYYEDNDLCFGVRDQGQRVVYQPASVIFHHGPSAAGIKRTEAQCRTNRVKFAEKWATALRDRVEGRMQNDKIAARELRPGLRVLLIDVSSSIAADELADRGCVVTFVPQGECEREKMLRLRQRGVEVLPGEGDSVQAMFRKRFGCFEAVLVGSVPGRVELLALARRRLPITPRYEALADLVSAHLPDVLRQAS